MKNKITILSFLLSVSLLFYCVSPVFADNDLSVSAESAVLLDAASGEILYQKNSSKKLPMASTTKIMTAICAIESALPLDEKYNIPKEACGVEGSSIYLTENESLTLRELLYALMLSSANDAATAIAIIVGGSIDGFADIMNRTSEKLGLKSTHFTNPHGLDHEEHYTTSEELAKITAYALSNEVFSEIVKTDIINIPRNNEVNGRRLKNHNKMLWLYDGAIGVKTGFTKRCGRCLVTAAQRDGVTLISVTLNAPDDWRDHTALLNYGFSKYETINIASCGDIKYDISCAGLDAEKLTVANRDELNISLPIDHPEIKVLIECPKIVFAPIEKDAVLGTVTFIMNGKIIGVLPLYAENSVNYIED